MASTYLSLHYHIVFSTKNRASTFRAEWLPEIHRYLGGTVKSLGGIAESVGGVADHIHALVGLKATHCLADFMREWKKSTSAWIKTQFNLPEFAW